MSDFYIENNEFFNEEIDESFMQNKTIDNIKKKISDIVDLKNQWKKVADSFVKHKWIERYINENQKKMLDKYYDMLTAEDVSYNDYKKAFKFISNFMGLPYDKIIIENLTFEYDNKDKTQLKVCLRYSKGLAKVYIPDDVNLIHVSPVNNINSLEPSFRSKVKGKYMYPSKRCFFTVSKDIKKNHAGLEKTKTFRYVTKENIHTAYIDPTYSDYKDGSVYIDTESPIPVEREDKKFLRLFNKNKEKKQ